MMLPVPPPRECRLSCVEDAWEGHSGKGAISVAGRRRRGAAPRLCEHDREPPCALAQGSYLHLDAGVDKIQANAALARKRAAALPLAARAALAGARDLGE